jgi:ectoine hydroxylase-related dioxygenase (phytanoyl-CoA dioxygenase family)
MSIVTDDSFVSEEQLTQFHRDGFLVVRGLISKAEIDVIRDTFMELNKDGPVEGLSEMRHHKGGEYTSNDPLAFYPRMMHPHNHPDKPVGPLAMKYMLDGRIRSVLRSLLGEEPFACQSMFYFKPPGARGQDLHQDNFYLRVKPGTCMAAWVAVDDADEENGGMMCVPNTATLAIACPEKSDPKLYFTTEHVEPPAGMKPETVRLKAGDVLFFNGSVIHGSTPNTSKTRFRRSFICHYVPASTKEMSSSYKVFSFEGVKQQIQHNNDGGPCGTMQPMPTAPH